MIDPDALLTEGAHLHQLIQKWREQAEASRLEASRIHSTIHASTDAEERCRARAETWDWCANELETNAAPLLARLAQITADVETQRNRAEAAQQTRNHFIEQTEILRERLAQITKERDAANTARVTWAAACDHTEDILTAEVQDVTKRAEQAESQLAQITEEKESLVSEFDRLKAQKDGITARTRASHATAIDVETRLVTAWQARAEQAEADLARLHTEGVTLIVEMREAVLNADRPYPIAIFHESVTKWADRLSTLILRPEDQ